MGHRSSQWMVVILAVGALGSVAAGPGRVPPLTRPRARRRVHPWSTTGPRAVPAVAPVGALPPAAQVTEVLRCVASTPERVAGDGEWQVVLRQRATGPTVPALVSALGLPPEPWDADQACAAAVRLPTAVELETASGPVLVVSPRGVCRWPLFGVMTAHEALPWVMIGSTRVRQLRSEAAVAGDCGAWKDMVAVEERQAKPGTAGPVLEPDASVSVCVYRSDYPPGWVAAGGGAADGIPLGGRKLITEEAHRLGTLLATAGPAAPCAVAHTSFAVVAVEGGDRVYVELDGCLRVPAPDHTLRQGDADTPCCSRSPENPGQRLLRWS